MLYISHQADTEHISEQTTLLESLPGNSEVPFGIELAAPSPAHIYQQEGKAPAWEQFPQSLWLISKLVESKITSSEERKAFCTEL